jgi:cell division protein FtsA
MAATNSLIVGLDAGTYKVSVVVAEVVDGALEIVGLGTAASNGVRKGVVVNIDATVESMRKAIEEAELMAGCDIRRVSVTLGGSHLRGFNSHGIVAVRNREVSAGDVERVMDAARAVALPMDRELLHVLPQDFIVDDQDGIREPVGMAGVRLEARVHIVTGAITSAQNLMKCCRRVGLDVTDVLAGSLAAAEGTLSPEEKEIGVALVDIGGGATNLVICQAGAVKHTAVLPIGGGHLTNDVAAGLRTPVAEAEKLKQRHGCAAPSQVGREETIEVPGVGGRGPRLVRRQMLGKIIEPRLEEIFSLVADETARAGYDEGLASGIVLTGGAAILEGTAALAERVFKAPVRIGSPLEIGGLVDAVNSPMYSAGVGLVLHALSGRQRGLRHGGNGLYRSSVRARIVGWLRDVLLNSVTSHDDRR